VDLDAILAERSEAAGTATIIDDVVLIVVFYETFNIFVGWSFEVFGVHGSRGCFQGD